MLETYTFPERDLHITASVFYTDELLACTKGGRDSVMVAVVMSKKEQNNAVAAGKNAVAAPQSMIHWIQRELIAGRKAFAERYQQGHLHWTDPVLATLRLEPAGIVKCSHGGAILA